MANWWFINSINMLSGFNVPGTTNTPGGDRCNTSLPLNLNPPRLSDTYIAHIFHTIPAAVSAYLEIRGTMLEEEQARIDNLLAQAQNVTLDPVIASDAFQNTLNRQGVRTVGTYGGTRRGGNN